MDAKWNPQLSESAKYLLYAQLLAAGSVILSRTQCVSAEELQQTKTALRELVSEEDSEVSWKGVLVEKNWDELTDEDLEGFLQAGYAQTAHRRMRMDHGSVFSSELFVGRCRDVQEIREKTARLFTDPSFGHVLRVKGLMSDAEKQMYIVNATPESLNVDPCGAKRGIFIVLGQELDADAIGELFG